MSTTYAMKSPKIPEGQRKKIKCQNRNSDTVGVYFATTTQASKSIQLPPTAGGGKKA